MEVIQSLLSLFGNITILALMLFLGLLVLLYFSQNSIIYLPGINFIDYQSIIRNAIKSKSQYEWFKKSIRKKFTL